MTTNRYSVYIVRCRDNSYYTGITSDLERRLAEHQHGNQGAKYLKGRRPLTLVFSAEIGERSQALRVEHRIKQLDRRQKDALVNGQIALSDLVAHQVSVSV